MRRRLHCAITVALLAASGCGSEFKGPEVIVANHSDQTLKDVTISGSGFMTSIGQVHPRSAESTIVNPIGESAIRVTFNVNGKAIDSGDCCKFTNNSRYAIAVNVGRDLQVTTLVGLKDE